ncbi:hypothetical protein Y1Q_0005497 [Alligator mississippiensis]|uniref:Uncharacterized protein n=1 Tax=Alligator mississippiensis TaxID=8496 RepID=A0A151MER0_ALLMI|nr:hypothetical protein Y1Q_0005497 [Alligator mississippiensis]
MEEECNSPGVVIQGSLAVFMIALAILNVCSLTALLLVAAFFWCRDWWKKLNGKKAKAAASIPKFKKKVKEANPFQLFHKKKKEAPPIPPHPVFMYMDPSELHPGPKFKTSPKPAYENTSDLYLVPQDEKEHIYEEVK